MKMMGTLLAVALAIGSSVVTASDSDSNDGGNSFPFERAAGTANNYVPAGSAAYNNPNTPPPPQGKVT